MHDLFSDLHLSIQWVSRIRISTQWDGENEHRDPFSRLYWVGDGAGRMVVAGEEYAVTPGSAYLIPSQTRIRHLSSPGMELLWVHFQARVLAGMGLFEAIKCPVCLGPADGDACARDFQALLHAYSFSGLADGVRCQGWLRLLLAPFLEAGRVRQVVERFDALAAFRPVLEYIEANLAEPIRLEMLANFLHQHPTYFSNQFAAHFGMPPREYIKRKRIEAAQMLLWQTDEPLKSIARRVGYGDACYFSRIFRKTTSLTPRAYRLRRERFLHP